MINTLTIRNHNIHDAVDIIVYWEDSMSRDTSIAVSEEEKARLDDVAQEEFGTEDVPYGATITALIQEHNE